MVYYKDRYYASQCDFEKDAYAIYIYEYNKSGFFKKWKNIHSFNVAVSGASLSICDDVITCCSATGCMIGVYSLRGELLAKYGSPGSGEAGKFISAFTYYGDDAGSVLVCDLSNNRLQVMSKDGGFRVLKLEPAAEQPCSAVLYKNHLYVTCDENSTVCKYKTR